MVKMLFLDTLTQAGVLLICMVLRVYVSLAVLLQS